MGYCNIKKLKVNEFDINNCEIHDNKSEVISISSKKQIEKIIQDKTERAKRAIDKAEAESKRDNFLEFE